MSVPDDLKPARSAPGKSAGLEGSTPRLSHDTGKFKPFIWLDAVCPKCGGRLAVMVETIGERTVASICRDCTL